MRSNRQTARIAGLLYFLLAVIGIFSIVYVPSRIIVYGDAAGTASNIGAHEMLFRAGIVGDLVCQTLFVFLALTLFHWFKHVDRKYALMAGCFSILIETFCSLVFPESYGFVSQFTAIPSALGEFSAILWFLIFGARESSPVTAESSSLSPMR
jgi:hypothetical protein